MLGDLFRSVLGELAQSAAASLQQATAPTPNLVSVDLVPDSLSELRTTAPPGDEQHSAWPGSLDSTFGRRGAVAATLTGGKGRSLAIHSDGSYAVAGVSTSDRGSPSITIARYEHDGRLLRSFGKTGCVRLDLAYDVHARSDSIAAAVAFQSDGCIVIAGSAQQPPSAFSFQDLALARLTPDGRLDPTFARTGWMQLRLGMASAANAVCVEPDGRILAAGFVRVPQGGRFQILIMRLMANGDPDPSFGSGGFVVLPAESDVEQAVAIAKDPRDGKIVGAARQERGFDKAFIFFRLKSNGQLDPEFGNNGRRSLDLGPGDNEIGAIAVQPDGKCVAAGYLNSRQYVLLRLDQAGHLDPEFSGSGVLKGAFGTGSGVGSSGSSFGMSVIAHPDGAIYLGGCTTEQVRSAGYAAGMTLYDADRSCALARFLSDGQLDSSFGAQGVVLVDLGKGENEIHAIGLDGDTIVAAGHSSSGVALMRFHTREHASDVHRHEPAETNVPPPQRSPEPPQWLDPTFGNNGALFADFDGVFAEARAIARQPDGYVVIVGWVGEPGAPNGRDLGVIRIAPDGALDDTFGSGGYKLLDVEATDNVAHAVALGPNGTLILAGEILDRDRGTSDFALVRLNADGQADTGFRGGVVVTDFLYGADNRAFAVDVQADGKIIAAGFTTYPQDGITGREGAHFDEPTELLGTEFFALARYNADGTLDQSFGSGGLVTTVMAPGPAGSARARAVQIQTDGRIVAAGTASGGAGTTSSRVALARYLTDGTLDESFGGTGRVLLDIDGTDEGAYAMAIDPRDGTIVVAGATARDVESQQHFLIARLDCDGRLDPTFNRTGGVTNRAFAGVARAVLLLPDGRVIAAGSAAAGERAENGEFVTREQVALACYTQDGSSDESFGMGGILLLDLGGDIDGASGLALDGNSILVVGSSRTGARSSFAVLRLNMAQM